MDMMYGSAPKRLKIVHMFVLVFGIVNVVSFVSTVACNVKELYEFNLRRFNYCLLNMK